jgi:methionine synthase I (cobalamin-dependent)
VALIAIGELLEELNERVVCGDGAMGTLLLGRGVPVQTQNPSVVENMLGQLTPKAFAS